VTPLENIYKNMKFNKLILLPWYHRND